MLREKMTDLGDNYIGLRMSDGTGMYLLGFVFFYVINLAMLIVASIAGIVITNLYFNYAVMAATQFSLFVAPLLYAQMFKREVIRPSRIKRSISPLQAIICVFVAFATMLACLPLANLVGDLLQMIGYKQGLSIPLAQADKWWTLPLSLLFVAVLPAIGEEFLFRGNIARAFKKRGYVFAMIMSALLFAVIHGNPLQLVHQFVLGIVMCFAYFVTGSLWAPMIIHFTNNATSLIVLYIQDVIAAPAVTVSWGTKMAIYTPMVIVGALLIYLVLRALTRTSRKRAGQDVGKVSVVAMLKDLGRAFYPAGIIANNKALNATMSSLYNDPTDSYIAPTPEEEVGDMEDKKLRDQLIDSKRLMEKKRKRADRTSLIVAIALSVCVIVFNLIRGIVK